MDAHGKKGIWIVGFTEQGEVGEMSVEMSGRCWPFGIGTRARFKLVEAPIGNYTAIFPFFGSVEAVRAQLAEFVVNMNVTGDRLQEVQSPIQVVSLELMDRAAMDVA